MGTVLGDININFNLDNSSTEKELKNKKQEEYIEYIKEHVNNVILSFKEYFLPLLEKENLDCKSFSFIDLKNAIELNKSIINQHDSSKYSDEEFEPYRLKFYPTNYEKSIISSNNDYSKLVVEKFEEAWKHHYVNNPHHPNHWVDDNGNIRDMDLKYIVEMLCDWQAMSIKFNSNTIDWYTNNAKDEKECMTDNTKSIVEDLLFNIGIFNKK